MKRASLFVALLVLWGSGAASAVPQTPSTDPNKVTPKKETKKQNQAKLSEVQKREQLLEQLRKLYKKDDAQKQ